MMCNAFGVTAVLRTSGACEERGRGLCDRSAGPVDGDDSFSFKVALEAETSSVPYSSIIFSFVPQ